MNRVADSYPMLLPWVCPVYPVAPHGLVSAENGLLKKLSASQTRLIAKGGMDPFRVKKWLSIGVQARPVVTLLAIPAHPLKCSVCSRPHNRLLKGL
jgi:hypothetical protein